MATVPNYLNCSTPRPLSAESRTAIDPSLTHVSSKAVGCGLRGAAWPKPRFRVNGPRVGFTDAAAMDTRRRRSDKSNLPMREAQFPFEQNVLEMPLPPGKRPTEDGSRDLPWRVPGIGILDLLGAFRFPGLPRSIADYRPLFVGLFFSSVVLPGQQ